jgi:phenylpropionate dioxygenase-like ring-hydroxylating dioxygenase large terminal subunit
VPPNACQFSFPTRDRYGIIWAFNGTKPLFELPDMALPDDELVCTSWVNEMTVPCSPTEIFVQVADWGHLRFMHEGTVQTTESQQNMVPDFKFNPYNFGYQVAGMTLAGEERGEGGQEFPQVKIYVHGTTIIHIETYVQENWAGVIGTSVIRGPGKTQIFGAVAVPKGDGSPEETEKAQQQLEFHKNHVQLTGQEDFVIYENIRFAPGALTEIDNMVVKYLDYVTAFPRANPAANFIYG